MYARLKIHHTGRATRSGHDLVGRLETTFGPNNPRALDRSVVFAEQAEWRNQVAFAVEKPEYLLVCYPAASDQLQLHVEPIHENLRDACASVWRSTRRTARLSDRVRLGGLTVIDEVTDEDVATAESGWQAAIARKELWPGLFVAVLTIVWIPIAFLIFGTADEAGLIQGAIPSIVIGAVSLILLVGLHGKLAWKEEDWQ